MQYGIIGAMTEADLQEKVNEACKTGHFMPLGGIAVQPLAFDPQTGKITETRFIQAMQACLKIEASSVTSVSFIDAIRDAKKEGLI